MSETILAGDITIFHRIDNNQMRLDWTGAAGDERTLKESYLALQTAFDAQGNMKEGEPMSGQTQVEYTIGQIDQFDPMPWFIDRESAEHFTNGALQTANWTRATGTYAGLVKVVGTNTNIDASDVGLSVSHADLDAGVIVGFKDGGGAGELELWIRPDSSAAGDDWDSVSGVITVAGSGHTANQTIAAADGESLWSGIFTQGSIAGASVGGIDQGSKMHIYVYQGGTRLVSYQSTTTDYWTEDGHIDHLFLVKEVDTLIDEGFVTVQSRQYAATSAYWTVDISGGGRNAVPIGTANDLNVTEGYRTNTGSAGSNTFDVGSEISGGSSGARGILTAVSGTVGTPILQYFLIGEPMVVFTNGETITEVGGDASCTSGTPANDGPPVDVTGVTVTHANDNSIDVDEDGTNEYFSVVIDCNGYTLAEVYQWIQYQLRRGDTTTTYTDGIAAESYLGIDYRMSYTTLTGTVNEGDVVVGQSSGAVGTVVAHHTTPKILTLRTGRGVWQAGETAQVSGGNDVSNVQPTPITPNAASPFGTFAGGFWFLSPGYVPINYDLADENSWSTTDDEGATKAKPIKVTIDITNTRIDDWIALFKLDGVGGLIDDDEYAISGTPAIGSTALSVTPAIDSEKPAAGKLVVRDTALGEEHHYRYTSYTGSTFTLYNTAGTASGGTDDNTLFDSTGTPFANAKVGDIVYNNNRTAWAYISEIVSDNQVELDRDITGQVSTDTYTVGATVEAYTSADFLWVPFLMVYELVGTDGAPGSEQTTITYSAPLPVLLRVRNADNATYKIKNFAVELSIGAGGLSQGVIRQPETIAA